MSVGNGRERHIEIQDQVMAFPSEIHKAARWSYVGEHPAIIDTHGKDVFEVSDIVASYFAVPFSSVKFCGSSQTGFSFVKKTAFVPRVSDLDVAIIDMRVFMGLKEAVYRSTKGYSDLSCFPRRLPSCSRPYEAFVGNLAVGYINPYHLPNCQQKQDIGRFSNRLTAQFRSVFKSVSFAFYETEFFFVSKQESALRKIIEVV